MEDMKKEFGFLPNNASKQNKTNQSRFCEITPIFLNCPQGGVLKLRFFRGHGISVGAAYAAGETRRRRLTYAQEI